MVTPEVNKWERRLQPTGTEVNIQELLNIYFQLYTPTPGTIWAVHLVPFLNTVWLEWLGSLSHIGGHPLESRPNLTARRTAENNSRCSFRKVICVIVASVSKELTEQAYEIRTSGDLYLKQVWHIYWGENNVNTRISAQEATRIWMGVAFHSLVFSASIWH